MTSENEEREDCWSDAKEQVGTSPIASGLTIGDGDTDPRPGAGRPEIGPLSPSSSGARSAGRSTRIEASASHNTGLGIALGPGEVEQERASARSIRRISAVEPIGTLFDDPELQSFSYRDPLDPPVPSTSQIDSITTTRISTNESSDVVSIEEGSITSRNPHGGAGGTYLSVADSPLGRFAAEHGPTSTVGTVKTHSPRNSRSFFSNLLNRSPKPNQSSSPTTKQTAPASPTPGPSTPTKAPRASGDLSDTAVSPTPRRVRSMSVSSSPDLNRARQPIDSRPSLDVIEGYGNTPVQRRTPLSKAVATFSGLTRSSSNRSVSSPTNSSPMVMTGPAATNSNTLTTSRLTTGASPLSPTTPHLSTSSSTTPSTNPSRATTSNNPTRAAATATSPISIGFATPPTSATTKEFKLPLETMDSIGLNLFALTQNLPVGKYAQPLCGAILDDKFLLIGTTAGLDFLPLPVPGANLKRSTNGKKTKETRKPISLIKRTRFKELAILGERSNILLAVAGRNDHVRVYTLEGIRSMIMKAMAGVDNREGYPFVIEADKSKANGRASAEDPKGKRKATNPSAPTGTMTAASTSEDYRFPATTSISASAASPPPPEYFEFDDPQSTTLSDSPRNTATRRTSTATLRGSTSRPGLRHSASSSIVRAIPTNPRPSSFSGPSSNSTPSANPSFAGYGNTTTSTTSQSAPPRSLRGQKSRDFVASRRNSSATVVSKRRSRGDMNHYRQSPSLSNSRRSSVVSVNSGGVNSGGRPTIPSFGAGSSSTSGSPVNMSRSSSRDLLNGSGDHLLNVDNGPSRRGSATSTSGWATSTSLSPNVNTSPRLEPRETLPIRRSSLISSPSQTADLASFLRDTGPNESNRSTATTRLQTEEIDSSAEEGWVEVEDPISSSPDPEGTKKQVARHASVPKLRVGETSPSMMLAEFSRGSAPTIEGTIGQTRRSISSPSLVGRNSRSPPLPRVPSEEETCTINGAPAPNLVEDVMALTQMQNELARSSAPAHVEGLGIDSHGITRPSSSGGGSTSSTSRKLVARGAKTISTTPDTSPEVDRRAIAIDKDEEQSKAEISRRRLTLAEIIRDDPPPPPTPTKTLPSSSSTPNGFLAPTDGSSSNGAGGNSPRSSKRWTMSSVGSMFLSRSTGASGSNELQPSEPARRPVTSAGDNHRSGIPRSVSAPGLGAGGEFGQQQQHSERPLPPTPIMEEEELRQRPSILNQSSSTSDVKRRGNRGTLDPAVANGPRVPASSRLPADNVTTNIPSPLDYVKLARTKGARLMRAFETKKRTYLAVLTGEENDRIELFTGSRGISLSLNRTFVLPERPRSIEFQMQGDDLVDICECLVEQTTSSQKGWLICSGSDPPSDLIYAESIFALEPATVRVREVGVGRGERRARRERERSLRDIAANASEPVEGSAPVADEVDPTSTLHPADHAAGMVRSPTPDSCRDGSNTPTEVNGAMNELGNDMLGSARPASAFPAPPRSPNIATLSEAREAISETALREEPRSKTPTAPYTTFQQLPFIPPVPSSVLASAWTIPPLYTDVVDADADSGMPDPPFAIPTALHSKQTFNPSPNPAVPLLSPISLLGPAAHQSSGPPGLFFVSKGSNLSGIVTADGKSVIKRPLVWGESRDECDSFSEDEPYRIEILLRGSSNTIVVGIAQSSIKAIAVRGELPDDPPFGRAVAVTNPSSNSMIGGANQGKDVVWLGTHLLTGQMFYAERFGSNFAVKTLFAKK